MPTPQAAAAATTAAGVLRAAAFPSAHRALFPPALVRLRARHPDLEVQTRELEPEDSVPKLRLGELDLVLAQEYDFAPATADPALERTPLQEDPIRLAVPAAHDAGAGFALVPDLAGPPPPGVRIVPSAQAIPSRRIFAAVRAGNGARPAVRAVLEALEPVSD